MCGIFGVVRGDRSRLPKGQLADLTKNLLLLSESRGKESAGLAVRKPTEISVYKQADPASVLVKSPYFKSLVADLRTSDASEQVSVIGHSRLVTNGSQAKNSNNQPVIREGVVCIHNGIIVNDGALWAAIDSTQRKYDIDSEIVAVYLRKRIREGLSVDAATADTFSAIEGVATVAMMIDDSREMVVATNNGSLYYVVGQDGKSVAFASERYILERSIADSEQLHTFSPKGVRQLTPKTGLVVDQISGAVRSLEFASPTTTSRLVERVPVRDVSSPEETEISSVFSVPQKVDVPKRFAVDPRDIEPHLTRCTRCLIPHTFPGVSFDTAGVCSLCQKFKPFQPKGHDTLEGEISANRSHDGSPDCLVAVSGGRDSVYGLHYVKTVLGLNPIAFTYDWGMVNDLARRNISRICGKLGIEHIIVSADINKKREYIRKNVKAWLKKPDLGMIPLFTAGDKQFFYYANQLKKQLKINFFVFCSGNEYEQTEFKIGYMGVRGGSPKGVLNTIGLSNKLRMVGILAKKMLSNPAYLNASIFDTMFAYASTYFIKHDYIHLYHYLAWDEKQVMDTVINEYNWELSDDSVATWRIGDGTSPFYNYIYHTVGGFTEYDTFRSNQIRMGKMSREEGLAIVQNENQPRFPNLKWYCDTLGLDFIEVLDRINRIPKRY